MSGRPLDVLEASLDEPVTVSLKDGTAFFGTLAGYDQHMNVVLEDAADAPTLDDGGALGDLDVEAVEDTTIIRGDNVVSIKA
ncbi:LSM domain-containing protein [Halobium palmae]|uniref:LSM domain-containing protein n=1 Tax=Halobium palmae TaxID=1776492 RepID=A0ABD5RZN0_9EURY